jgi:acetyltransferase-like isoleucine patch superfamily enzyme
MIMGTANNSFNRGYCESDELRQMGFNHVGRNVCVARSCTLVGLEHISLGNDIRIDDHVSIIAESGFLKLGNHIHIGAGCYLGCSVGITLADFSGLSQGVKIYSASDDYSGKNLTNPTVPSKYRRVKSGPVHLGRHVIVGSGSVILPGVAIGDGASIGALSLVTKSLGPWGVYFGSPVRRLKSRSQEILALEQKLHAENRVDADRAPLDTVVKTLNAAAAAPLKT